MSQDVADIVHKRTPDAIEEAVARRDRALTEFAAASRDLMRLHALKLVEWATSEEAIANPQPGAVVPLRKEA